MTPARTLLTIVLPVLLSMAGCRTLPGTPVDPASRCLAGERAMTRDTLYFGRSLPDGGTVDDAQWQAFVDDTITPAFPSGFTIVHGNGQWRGGDGRIQREASEVVTVLHAGDAPAMRAVAAIAEAYKARFHQEAVLRERTPACARF